MHQSGRRGGLRRGLVTLLLLALVLSIGPTAPARAQLADYPLAAPFGAHFYTQIGGAGAGGFAVSDADGVPFLTAFDRLGGSATVGRPISHRFVREDRVVQAFQKLVFEWHPETGRVELLNTLDALHDAGLDEPLATLWGVPPLADWSADTGLPFDRVERAHLALLDASPPIRAAYLTGPDPVRDHGLPMAPVHDMGGVLVLRAQRTVFQEWLEDRPWARAGQVTTLDGGELARALGLFPPDAVVPLPAGAAPLSVGRAAPELPAPTATPIPIPTPPAAPTATPSGPCYGDEEVTFYPPAPRPEQDVYVAVSSARRASGVSLNGAFSPVYMGVYPGGQGWFWSWRIHPDGAGQFGYEFTVGGTVCAASSVRVGSAQTAQLAPFPPLLPPFLSVPGQE
jgi:hypothetical protein